MTPELQTKIETGIYRVTRDDRACGFRVYAAVHDPTNPKGRVVSKRFPIGTARTTMRQWREDQRSEARRTPSPTTRPGEPGGFTADATRYLKAVAAMRSYVDRKWDIDRWIEVFGDRPRATISSAEIASHLALWSKTLAASTVNHRRTALMHLWSVLDGRGAANPAKATPKYREPDAAARGVSYDLIRRILQELPATKSRARLKVIAWTGIPHAQLGRLTEADVDLERRFVIARGRLKGRGTSIRSIPLTDEAVEAFKEFIARRAWGGFSSSSLRKAFRAGCDVVTRAEAQKPADERLSLEGLRPYDLRHSFGTMMYRATGDIRATQLLLGHASTEMTHRYTLGAVDARLAQAVQAFNETTAPPAPTTDPVWGWALAALGQAAARGKE